MKSLYLDENRGKIGFFRDPPGKKILKLEAAKIFFRYSCYGFLLCALVLPCALPAQRPELPVLSRVDQVLELTPQQAKLGYPVHLEGVVTVSERSPRLFYVQDETGGIYVDLHGRRTEPLPGARVEIWERT